MISLLIVAAMGQCSSGGYGYGQTYYRAQTYVQPTYYAPAQTYAAPAQTYQQPVYNQSLVADYMRQEAAYQAAAKTEAKLDVLLKLLTERATPPPAPQPQPQPQFQAPYPTPQQPSKSPPAQFEQTYQAYPTPQQPSKGQPEQFQYQPQPQYQAQPSQQWAPQDQPPYGTKPAPSFEASGWVPPPSSPSLGGGVAAMTSLFQARCSECHVGSSDKGGGVKLLEIDGTLAQLNEQLLKDIASATSSGRMPKKGPRLGAQELQAVYSGLNEYAATARARANVVASFGQ